MLDPVEESLYQFSSPVPIRAEADRSLATEPTEAGISSHPLENAMQRSVSTIAFIALFAVALSAPVQGQDGENIMFSRAENEKFEERMRGATSDRERALQRDERQMKAEERRGLLSEDDQEGFQERFRDAKSDRERDKIRDDYRERTEGRESLLSKDETENFRNRMKDAGSPDERRAIAEEHRSVVNERSKERGYRKGGQKAGDGDGGKKGKKSDGESGKKGGKDGKDGDQKGKDGKSEKGGGKDKKK